MPKLRSKHPRRTRKPSEREIITRYYSFEDVDIENLKGLIHDDLIEIHVSRSDNGLYWGMRILEEPGKVKKS